MPQQRKHLGHIVGQLAVAQKRELAGWLVARKSTDDGACLLTPKCPQMPLHAQGKPEQEPSAIRSVWDKLPAQTLQAVPISVSRLVPILVDPFAFLLPRGESFAVKTLSIPRNVEQGLAKVEHAFHTQTELADRTDVARLASDAKGTKVLGIVCPELAVVEEPETGALQ